MNEMRKYVRLIESQQTNVFTTTDDDNHYLFTYEAERLYESSGMSWQLLLENRVQWLRDNMMHKLEPIAYMEDRSTEELFDWIIEQDPTQKKQYSQWLMKILVGKNSQSTIQDLRNAKVVLRKYEELKKDKKLKPEHKDLNRFKSIAELKSAIFETENSIDKENEAMNQKARNQSDILYEDDTWIIVVPKTEYAAGYWGMNSKWCTAAGFKGGRQEDRTNNMFEEYNEVGKMYTFVNKKDPMDIYQLSIAKFQFMDSENKRIEYPKTKEIFTISDEVIDDVIHEIRRISHGGYAFDNLWDLKTFVFEYIPEELNDYIFEITDTAENAYTYAKNVKEGRFEEREDIIAQDSKFSFKYAKNILKGKRIEKIEKAIAQDAESSFLYAFEVVRGRFEEGEDVISKSEVFSTKYAVKVLKGKRFEKGEDVIARDATSSLIYAMGVLNGRFEKGEDAIAKEGLLSFIYATDIIKGRFEKGEKAISKDASDDQKQVYYELTGIQL